MENKQAEKKLSRKNLRTEPTGDHKTLGVPDRTQRVPEYEPEIGRDPNVPTTVHLADGGDGEGPEGEPEEVHGEADLRRGRVEAEVARDVVERRGRHARRYEGYEGA